MHNFIFRPKLSSMAGMKYYAASLHLQLKNITRNLFSLQFPSIPFPCLACCIFVHEFEMSETPCYIQNLQSVLPIVLTRHVGNYQAKLTCVSSAFKFLTYFSTTFRRRGVMYDSILNMVAWNCYWICYCSRFEVGNEVKLNAPKSEAQLLTQGSQMVLA